MAFNITEFKSTMNKYGGHAHTGLFEVNIVAKANTNSSISARELTFFCKTMSIPGITLNTETYTQVGKLPREMPMGIQNNPVNGIFLIDSNHQILRFFHSWMQQIVNYSTSGGDMAMVDDLMPYEVAYREDYSATITIKFYNPHPTGTNNTYYETVLYDAFPTSVGEIDLSWENNDSYATLPVSFTYDKIRFAGEKQGSPTTRFNRGTGLLTMINSIGNIGNLVRNRFLKVTGIQDAVDRLNSVKNSWDNITNFFR